jgi:hypothetical protein
VLWGYDAAAAVCRWQTWYSALSGLFGRLMVYVACWVVDITRLVGYSDIGRVIRGSQVYNWSTAGL